MWLIRAAMRRPITILIVIVGAALMSLLAVQRMKIDIFPDLGTPVIYVAQPYGGMDPAQMEGFIANYYEYHFLYVTGIEHVESKSIQGATLLKLLFHEGTDMSLGGRGDRRAGESIQGIHAAGDGAAVRGAFRWRQCAGGLSRVLERNAGTRGDPGPRVEPDSSDVWHVTWGVGTSAVRRQPTHRGRPC